MRIFRLVATRSVQRLNRHRSPGQRIPFRSKNRLARAILEDLRPFLPAGWTITVQFDSWYASEQLIQYVRHQNWQFTCGLKPNRKLNGQRIDQLASALRHRRYLQVQVTAADGKKRTYYVRETTGRLEKVPFEVRAFFSKRHPREKSPAYFMSTDLTRSAQIKTYGDLIRRHRDEHAIEWLTGALEMMRETHDLQAVLQRYLHLETISP